MTATKDNAKPYSWPPSESWDGADGDWSSFGLRIGKPEQGVRILPSTAGQALWVVYNEGCLPGEPGKIASITCTDSRGETFDISKSTSWTGLGNYTVNLETNLDYDDSAAFGLDTVALGDSEAIGGPHVHHQVVAALATEDFYIGMLGLSSSPTNLTNVTDPHPSFLTTLKAQDAIPSLSYGFTAGGRYQSKAGAFGSLTLGGYDDSRFVDNDVTFHMHPDNTRDLVAGLQTITTDFSGRQNGSILSDPIYVFIDSTIPDLYLPVETCKAFEQTLGLIWNETYQTYFVDDNLHQKLINDNISITFTLGDSKTSSPTVDITLPYASFDLVLDYPLVPQNMSGIRYFPLLRADNDTQYTLGRTFLQEAYLITNYENSTFAVHQSKYQDGVSSNIIAIPSLHAKSKRELSRVAKIGISLAALLVLLMCLLSVALYVRARRKTRHIKSGKSSSSTSIHSSNLMQPPLNIPTQEVSAGTLIGLYSELPAIETPELPCAATRLNDKELIIRRLAVLGLHELYEPSAHIAYELGDDKGSIKGPSDFRSEPISTLTADG